MSRISDIMSPNPQVVTPEESLKRAAALMRQLDIGVLPVCSGSQVLGIVTDRDIAVRGVAAGLGPDSGCVSDVMTRDVMCADESQDSEELVHLMSDCQVRRVPVVNRNKELVGIVSLGDLATHHVKRTEETLREISEPARA